MANIPQSTRQTQGEILHELRKEAGVITEDRLQEVMAGAGVESLPTVKAYKKTLESLKLIERVAGGYELTKLAREDYTVLIRMPQHNKGAVLKGLDAALQQFKPLTTMEVEE